MPKHRKQSSSVKFAAVGVGVLFLVAVLVMTGMIPGLPRLGIVVPGWEIYDQIAGIECGTTLYTSASQFTSPRDVGAVYWKFDVDEPPYNVPTMEATIGDIHHVDFTGKEVPNTTPAETTTVTRGNWTWYFDHHIYSYTLTLRTIADVAPNGTYGLIPMWTHETLWPWEGWNGPAGGVNHNNFVGEKFEGGVFVKFVISPWTGVSTHDPPNASYVLDNCWAGVMNTYVLAKTQGQVENQYGGPYSGKPPDDDAKMYIAGGIEPGNQVNMFEDDGTYGTPALTVSWDPNMSPDVRIESTVVQMLPIQMGAGAKVSTDFWGFINGIYPCDVAVQYTVRVDVLQSHGFVLQTAINPPDPGWPEDYFGWAESFWTSVLAGLDPFRMFGPLEPFIWFLFTIGVILLIVFVLLAVFAPWVLPRIFKGVTSAGKAVREVTKKEK